MFCQNCGTQNDDAAAFCESCGAKLEKPAITPQPAPQPAPQSSTAGGGYTKPSNTAPKVKAPRKPLSKGAKVGIVAALVVVVAVVALYFVAKSITDPKNKVEEFAQAYVQHDAGKLFDVLEFQESDLVTKEKFEEALKTDSNQHFEDVTDYTIVDNQKEAEKALKKKDKDDSEKSALSYTIIFRDSANAFEYTKVITLTKQGTKSFLFFDNWRIRVDNFLTKDYSIQVPKGAQVSVDGVAMGESLLNTDEAEENQDCYKIPYMFSGNHKMQVSVPNFNPLESEFSSEASDYSGAVQHVIRADDMDLAEEAKNAAIEKAKETFQKLYAAMLGKKDFAEVIGEGDVVAERYEDMKSYYDSMVENTISQDTHLTKVEFKSVEASAEKAYADPSEGDAAVIVTLNTSYTADSVVKSFWTGKKEKKDYEGEKSFTFTYYLVDGNWLLRDSTAFNYSVDYSRY